nr:hypothetical protein BaRGS_002508 [Batillaria attramentaria]
MLGSVRGQFKKLGCSPDGGTFSGRVDRTTCSLMMVSALAFVTLVPKTLLEVMELAWTIQHDTDVEAAEEEGQEPPEEPHYLLRAGATWPLLNLIYLLNFGQNFYVMLIANFRYREVLQRTLFCRSKPRTAVNEDKTENDAVTTVSFSTTTQLVFLRALAISDTLVLITTCTEDNLDHANRLQNVLASSVGLCKMWTGLSTTVSLLSPWLVVLLSVDRYVGVVFPLKRASFCTLKVAGISIAVLTAVAMVTRIPDVVFNTVLPEDGIPSCNFDIGRT